MLSRIRHILFLVFYLITPHQYSISAAEANEERLIGGYRLIDRGASASSNRYTVILDKIDFSETLKKEYIISELPHEEGLELTFILEMDRDVFKKIGRVVQEKISNVKIELIIKNRKTGKVDYKYRGKLFNYVTREGLQTGEYGGVSGKRNLSWYLGFDKYRFYSKRKILGIETPFYKDVERSIELNIIEPLSSNTENYNFVSLVIQGGGWK